MRRRWRRVRGLWTSERGGFQPAPGVDELAELTDVDVAGVIDGATLIYDAAQQLWLDGTIDVGGAYRYVSGRWYALGRAPSGTIAVLSGVAQYGLTAAPFTVDRTMTIDQIGTSVSNDGGGAGTGRLAVYQDSGARYPTTMLRATASGAIPGAGTWTGALSPNLQLDPGLYWLAAFVTGFLFGVQLPANPMTAVGADLPPWTPYESADKALTPVAGGGLRLQSQAGAALPDPFPPAAEYDGIPAPIMILHTT